MNPQWVELAMAHTPHRRVILDMDSSESPVHGQQEGAAYNGHFECVCYHPLFLFNQFGDCEGATLRPGNVHSADGWQELLEPVVKGYQKKGLRLLFRGDAAFAKPELYEYLEQGKIGYAIRLPANQVIQEQIQPLLERPTEWPSREPIVSYHDFAYQAQSWHLPRRVAKVEWHQGELFPRVGFIVTNLSYPPKGIVRFYNGRGTAEQWIKEGKYALNWTRLSCHKFVANQVRLWLFVLTYNLGNFMRRLVLPEDMKHSIYHYTEPRVRAHLLLCMLAYWVQREMQRALAPLLFVDEAPPARPDPVAPAPRSETVLEKYRTQRTADGFPVHSFPTLLADRGTMVKNRVILTGVPEAPGFDQVTVPTQLQARALELLQLPINPL